MSFLRYLPGRVGDLAHCLECARDRFLYTGTERAALLKMWKELLSNGSASCPVIEDPSRPPTDRIRYFAFVVFVTDECLVELLTKTPPYWGHYFLKVWNENRRFLLRQNEIALANSGTGLNMICLSSGSCNEAHHGRGTSEIAARIIDFQYWAHGGYRLKTWLIEAYKSIDREWAEGYGLRLWRDYGSHSSESGPGGNTPRRDTPLIYGCSDLEAAGRHGSTVSKLFIDVETKLYLRPLEQELVLCALSINADDELANYLHISTPTVRKRWEAIYDKVISTPSVRDILPGFSSIKRNSDGYSLGTSRGTERKRQLLNYFRYHIEELRPTRPPVSSIVYSQGIRASSKESVTQDMKSVDDMEFV
jgi:hypothetical protein